MIPYPNDSTSRVEEPRNATSGFAAMPSAGMMPDPRGAGGAVGSVRKVVTWTIAIALMAMCVFMQRSGGSTEEEIANLRSGIEIEKPEATTTIMAKLIVAAEGDRGSMVGMFGPTFQAMLDQVAGWQPKGMAGVFAAPPGPEVEPMENERFPAADKLRAAIMSYEVYGLKGFESRALELEKNLDPVSELVGDLELLREIFRADAEGGEEIKVEAASSDPGTTKESSDGDRVAVGEVIAGLSPERVEKFKAHHGQIAELVLERGSKNENIRARMSKDGADLLMIFGIFASVFVIALLTGLVIGITGFVLMVSGLQRLKFPGIVRARQEEMRAISGSGGSEIVFVEMLCVFLLGFLGVKVVSTILLMQKILDRDQTMIASLIMQWLLALTIFWPMVRGMRWKEWREFVGWTAPKGVAREVVAGGMGYLAWLVVQVCGMIVVVIVYAIVNAVLHRTPEPQSSGERLQEMLGSGNVLVMALLFTLATMWAPLVEETIFRGALLRYWQPRLGVVVSVILTTLFFAILHGYSILPLIVVGFLGFGFALIRQWRGSIVGCITAHCIHNTVVMVLMLLIASRAG